MYPLYIEDRLHQLSYRTPHSFSLSDISVLGLMHTSCSPVFAGINKLSSSWVNLCALHIIEHHNTGDNGRNWFWQWSWGTSELISLPAQVDQCNGGRLRRQELSWEIDSCLPEQSLSRKWLLQTCDSELFCCSISHSVFTSGCRMANNHSLHSSGSG